MKAVVIAALLAGCQPRTELVIGIATDLPAPAMFDGIDLLVTNAETGEVAADLHWDITGERDVPDNLPGSIGIFSETDASQLALELVAKKGDSEVVTRTARITLVEGRTLFYRLGLAASCMTMADCDDGLTCVEGACRETEIDSAVLPEFADNLVEELTCAGGVTYTDTATRQPMAFAADAQTCNGPCSEGTCLSNLPGTERYRGVVAEATLDIVLGNGTSELTIVFDSSDGLITLRLAGTTGGTSFEATGSHTFPTETANYTVQGTFDGIEATGTIAIDDSEPRTIPIFALAGTPLRFCGTLDGDTVQYLSFVSSGDRAAGGARNVGLIDGTLRQGTLRMASADGAVTYTGELDATGTSVSGTYQGTIGGSPASGTFTAGQGTCPDR